MEQKITYSGIVLDERSRGTLRQVFGDVIPDGWEWVAHHMTICLGPIRDEGIKQQIGQTKTLVVTAIGQNDKAIAVKVDGFYSERPNAHVTLAVNRAEGGKPYHSNQISEWYYLDRDLRLTGTVEEVPFESAPLNEEVTNIQALPFIQDVKELGGKIYQVGGAVRDEFLGKQSKDLDILIQGVPADKLKVILDKYGKVDMVGASFGVIKFKERGSNEEIDIAIPRTERKIGAGYTGFEVNADHNLPVEKDLERRDFTINSIAKDLDGNISDPFKGQEDLKNKVIRVTNPIAFKEDPLRMLRAVQFAARFKFKIEGRTLQMIQQNAPMIKEISPERILIEFDKIVSKGQPSTGLYWLLKTGLFNQIFGFEFAGVVKYVKKVKTMAEFIFTLTHNSIPNVEQFYKGKLKGDLETARLIKAFDITKQLEGTGQMRDNHADCAKTIFKIFRVAPAALDSFIVRYMFELGPNIEWMKERNQPFSFKQMAISGNDLIKMGIPEGPKQGQILSDLLDKIYSGTLTNDREVLSNFVKQQPLNEAITTIKKRF